MCVISGMKFFEMGGGRNVKLGKKVIFLKKNGQTVICRYSTG